MQRRLSNMENEIYSDAVKIFAELNEPKVCESKQIEVRT